MYYLPFTSKVKVKCHPYSEVMPLPQMLYIVSYKYRQPIKNNFIESKLIPKMR